MRRLRLEMLLDIAWIVFASVYVAMASRYPPAGRLIPMVVGVTAIIVGITQLMGNFIPRMRFLTHDRKLGDRKDTAGTPPIALAPEPVPETGEVSQLGQWVSILWAASLILGILLIGFAPAIPLFFFVYFLIQKSHRNWKLAVGAAVAMGILTSGVFARVLDLHLYSGVLFS
ncbi:tripartite tricarboxylate transporter TctB family protein [Alicyclobacillus fastidiosus]|uniref:Tripartite tricarboxylate transporter TctB family protein n=1 Tax=Alicyclobacillus fastidiosus TaxID=392011 RepID=A0ABY6ZB48_9BACL|nr:tripartite tricarboxylate transporter TctB family protein [Alicyclobacillus fastidiosus]WAH40118.1 tripartite tricarboxylate transporter TctB family protein [Alicyclobacillus fastidiosus]